MHTFLRAAIDKQQSTLDLIEEFVNCESPSDSAPDLARFLELLAERCRDIATPTYLPGGGSTPCLLLDFRLGGTRKTRILGLGHADTVWPKGTLAQMPFRHEKGRLWGPGVLDMKAGLAFFIQAVTVLRDMDQQVPHQVSLLVVPDEETGSRYSRAVTETEAGKSTAVFVLEPGTGLTGKLKTSRKGVGNYTLAVRGKAAHAGVDFSSGASAIVEIARQIQRINEMTDLKRGTTVNPGVVRGGTASNVIAAEASVDLDVRTVRLKDAEHFDRKLRAIRAIDKRCTLSLNGGLNRPPMERTKAISKLYARAAKVAKGMGLVLEESATGGGSDGNFTAAIGVPTLDGLGGVGEGAHAAHESVLVDRVADRVALLAGLLAHI